MRKSVIDFLVKCGYMQYWKGGYHLTKKGQAAYGNKIDRAARLALEFKKGSRVGKVSHEKNKDV